MSGTITCPTYLSRISTFPAIHVYYRRSKSPGATYFFTVVTFRRRPFLVEPACVELLRAAFRDTLVSYPFSIDAFVLLPEHLHCLWTLPQGDMDYPLRWSKIKKFFTDNAPEHLKTKRSAAQIRKRAQTIWQPRYWEHQIRDEADYARHFDYIHWNPVKHGLVLHPSAWKYSSYLRSVRRGIYPPDWPTTAMGFDDGEYGE